MDENKFKQELAIQLKKLRQRQGLSLDAVAQKTGVSKSMLGQIERNQSSPTIATLWKIASGLNASFSAFFAFSNLKESFSDKTISDPNMKVTAIFPYQEDTKLEVLEVHLCNYHTQHSDAHAVGVIEHVYVVKGCLSVYCNNRWQELNVGDCLRFYADQTHAYRAVSDFVVFHNTVCYAN